VSALGDPSLGGAAALPGDDSAIVPAPFGKLRAGKFHVSLRVSAQTVSVAQRVFQLLRGAVTV
jgi:hypothetical protein